MIRIRNIKLGINHTNEDLLKQIYMKLNVDRINGYNISNKSIDARKKPDIKFVYSVDVDIDNEKLYINDNDIVEVENINYEIEKIYGYKGSRPVIIGSGPSGIFAGLILAKAGLNPIIIERGKKVSDRVKDVYDFFETGKLLEESNVQFGEGGAGTFSDGKLTTNSHDSRIKIVIDELIKAGADKSISYLSKPHIGTDELIKIVENIRIKIESLGGEYRFSNKFVDFESNDNRLESVIIEHNNEKYKIDTNYCILAIGHSARDTFYMLKQKI